MNTHKRFWIRLTVPFNCNQNADKLVLRSNLCSTLYYYSVQPERTYVVGLSTLRSLKGSKVFPSPGPVSTSRGATCTLYLRGRRNVIDSVVVRKQKGSPGAETCCDKCMDSQLSWHVLLRAQISFRVSAAEAKLASCSRAWLGSKMLLSWNLRVGHASTSGDSFENVRNLLDWLAGRTSVWDERDMYRPPSECLGFGADCEREWFLEFTWIVWRNVCGVRGCVLLKSTRMIKNREESRESVFRGEFWMKRAEWKIRVAK